MKVTDRFDELRIVAKAKDRVDRSGKRYKQWKCACSCGKFTIVREASLRSRNTKSCGHLKKELVGIIPTKDNSLYSIWQNMRNRTQAKHSPMYARCGGAGIKLHRPWINNFQEFERWVSKNLGTPKKNETIRRSDISGNFEPGNMEKVLKSKGKRGHQQTAPEAILAKLLDGRTFKYVGVGKAKYGQPISSDFVVPRLKLIVQVDGCYWHGCKKHSGRSLAECRNLRQKDKRITSKATSKGWTVVRVWEHAIIRNPEKVAQKLTRLLD